MRPLPWPGEPEWPGGAPPAPASRPKRGSEINQRTTARARNARDATCITAPLKRACLLGMRGRNGAEIALLLDTLQYRTDARTPSATREARPPATFRAGAGARMP